MTSRVRKMLTGLVLGLLAMYVALAQQKLTLPIQQTPGQPKKMVLAEAPPLEGASVHVVPGPEPWYSVFATGEVVGYIEPCG